MWYNNYYHYNDYCIIRCGGRSVCQNRLLGLHSRGGGPGDCGPQLCDLQTHHDSDATHGCGSPGAGRHAAVGLTHSSGTVQYCIYLPTYIEYSSCSVLT